MRTQCSITVIVPVYNEADLLKGAVHEMELFLAEHLTDFEIIIVESGSTDGSVDLCDELAKTHASVVVVHEGARNGFGSAVKVGWQHARKEFVWLVTVDFPFPLRSLLDALPLLADCDCVLSYRPRDCRGLMRRIQSYVYNSLVRTCLGLKVKQVNSAFKVIRREVVQDIELMSTGWFLDAELIYRMQERNVRLAEIPVELIERGSGKSSVTIFSWLSVLKELLSFLRHRSNSALSQRNSL